MKSSIAFFILFLTASLHVNLTAQEKLITGTVTEATSGFPAPGVTILIKGTSKGTQTDFDGKYSITAQKGDILVFSYVGFKTQNITVGDASVYDVNLEEDEVHLDEVVVVGLASGYHAPSKTKVPYNETYVKINENIFKNPITSPLSTFSIDVDRAAYSNVRRFINNGNLPPKDAVRIEEMINYFKYDYPQPENKYPFSINTEVSSCPWASTNLLLHVGLQGKSISMENLPPSNIVFLLDVSGSMSSANKLPLLKSSLKLLLETLRPQDRVAIVTYAGNVGLALPSTSCKNKSKIIQSLNHLEAGGSTAGGQGLKLAYKTAKENFLKRGNNRIIMATDGDFNVGISNIDEMKSLIEKERDYGISISVLGFGDGNYRDDMAEIIADNGNGNYSYIDNLLEAKKVLVNEFGGTFYNIAKDVKFQLEFNPAFVYKYRLIGYENRLLENEEFEDDSKDAGEIGAGHSVTAIYEIIPVTDQHRARGKLNYQAHNLTKKALNSNDLVTLKLRYKEPDKDKSKLIEQVVKNTPTDFKETSNNFRFSAAIAEFGMLLRDSQFKGTATWNSAIDLAKNARGNDLEGFRSEMIRLLESAKLLSNTEEE